MEGVREAWAEAGKDVWDEGGVPFSFAQREGRIDWKLLASVDPEVVSRRCDVRGLQAIIDNLTFADIERERAWSAADKSLMKLLRLAQLSIEYLVYSQVCSTFFHCLLTFPLQLGR